MLTTTHRNGHGGLGSQVLGWRRSWRVPSISEPTPICRVQTRCPRPRGGVRREQALYWVGEAVFINRECAIGL